MPRLIKRGPYEMNSILIVLIVFLVFFVGLGLTYRTNDSSEFHTFRRQANPIRLIASLFSIVGASEFVIFATLAFVFGVQSLYFFVGTLVGFWLLSFNVSRIRKNAASEDQHSIPDFAEDRDYYLVARSLAIISWAFTFTLVLMQVMIGGDLVSKISGLDYEVSAALVATAIALYLVFGGYKALLNTDVIQAATMFLLTLGLAGWALTTTDVSAVSGPAEVPYLDVMVFGIGGIFAIAGGPEIWQRILTAENDASAKRSLRVSGVAMFIWGVALVLLSLIIRTTMPDANPDTAFIDYILTQLPPAIVGLMIILLLAAMLSTADTELFAGSVIISDMIRGRSREPLNMTTTRVVIVATSVLAFAIAIFTDALLNVYLSLVYLSFITGPTAFALIRGHGTGPVFLASVFGSLGVFIYLLFSDQLVSWLPILILVIASVPFFVAHSKPDQTQDAEAR